MARSPGPNACSRWHRARWQARSRRRRSSVHLAENRSRVGQQATFANQIADGDQLVAPLPQPGEQRRKRRGSAYTTTIYVQHDDAAAVRSTQDVARNISRTLPWIGIAWRDVPQYRGDAGTARGRAQRLGVIAKRRP